MTISHHVLAFMYNTLISDTVNHLVPLKTRRVSLCRPAPWFTPETRKMKAAGRQTEHLSKKTGLTGHALAYKDDVRIYKDALNKAKTTYFSTIIAKGQVNPRALFQTINKLLQPSKQFPLAASTKLCCDFIDFFQGSIISIYQQLHHMSVQLNAITTPLPSLLAVFRLLLLTSIM